MKIDKKWLSGFVDGEGCFYIGLNQNKTMKHGIQVLPEFVLTQHQRDVKLLQAVRKFFGCGIVRPNKNKLDSIYCYRVRNIKHLSAIIVPFFEKNQLLTQKKFDFYKFKKVVRIIECGDHLTLEGLEEIKKIKNDMNNKGKEIVPSLLKSKE